MGIFDKVKAAFSNVSGRGGVDSGVGGGADAALGEVRSMQAYWQSYLQEKRRGLQGSGAPMADTEADAATAMADLDALFSTPQPSQAAPADEAPSPPPEPPPAEEQGGQEAPAAYHTDTLLVDEDDVMTEIDAQPPDEEQLAGPEGSGELSDLNALF
jgi:hypothetical protein